MYIINVIDCGFGNLNSLVQALKRCHVTVNLISDPTTISDADKIILPGVGSFAQTMDKLENLLFDRALQKAVIDEGIPFLGICVGMQVIASKGTEGSKKENSRTTGLNWIEGDVIKLQPENLAERIPHMGWNSIIHDENHPLFKNIPSGTDFYFANSYHFDGASQHNIISTTPYCGKFISSVAKSNIFGVQFHPEKSQKYGLQFLKNFIEL
jgi:glutamine amidotransferase